MLVVRVEDAPDCSLHAVSELHIRAEHGCIGQHTKIGRDLTTEGDTVSQYR
jgi:hypothetical protein